MVEEIDWEARWKRLVEERAGRSAVHQDPGYWDRRAPSYARSTSGRVDDFLAVVQPYAGPRKTLIDVGAGAGRYATRLAEQMEWVTAVEPSEGMRSRIPPVDNMTVVASTWEEADVAPADLVICCHVLYGIAEPVPFIQKLGASAKERVFVMLRESELPHPAVKLRRQLGEPDVMQLPRFTDLFGLLAQMGIRPDVTFLSYPIRTRYVDLAEAVADCRAMYGDGWDEQAATQELLNMLTPEGRELVFDGGNVTSGVAHWSPTS